METNFNFKSQVCTSRSQSKKLLALGIKPETADMSSDGWNDPVVSWGMEWSKEIIESGRLPAWSLHRLIEMADTAYLVENRRDDDNELWFCTDRCYCWNNHESFYATNLYDSLINCIEWLIKEGYFNKEYLEE